MRHVLPIIERELRVRARRPLTRWTRVGLAAATTLLVTNYVSNWSAYRIPGQNGMAFQILAGIGFLLALAAAFLTADAISSERREGTLGLLFLTELSGLEVTLGKTAAALISGIYVFIGFAPVLMLALLPGGVTGGEVLRVTLVLIATLLAALAIGVWNSVRQEESLITSRQTAFCLLAWLALPWLVEGILSLVSTASVSAGLTSCPSLLSPIAAFRLAGDVAYRADAGRFWLSLLILVAEAGLWLGFAGRKLGQNWRTTFGTAAQPRLRRVIRSLSDQANPIGWLVRRQPGQRALFWIACLLLLLLHGNLPIQLLLRMLGGSLIGSNLLSMLSSLSLVGGAIALALFGWLAGRFFLHARASGELELLLSTPHGASQMVRGQLLVLRLQLVWPSLLLLLSVPFLCALYFGAMRGAGGSLQILYLISMLVPVEIILKMWAATWLGLWFGLRCRNTWSLMAWTAGLVAGVSLAVGSLFWAFLALFGVSSASVARAADLTSVLLFLFRPILLFAVPIVLIWWARQKLRNWQHQLNPRH